MNIKPIKTKKDYELALTRIEKLWDAKPNTQAGDELDVLATLVEKYEMQHFTISPPDPIAAIKFRMEQMGLQQKDVAKIIGANRTSEILNKKRQLSLNVIKSLHTHLNIPVGSLLS